MTLLEIHADLSRTATALERIAAVLERAFPEIRLPRNRKPIGLEHYSHVTDAMLYNAQVGNQGEEVRQEEAEPQEQEP